MQACFCNMYGLSIILITGAAVSASSYPQAAISSTDNDVLLLQQSLEVQEAIESNVAQACANFCAQKVESGAKTWEQLCTWTKCAECTECGVTTTTTTYHHCEEWCAARVEDGKKTWPTLCNWDACNKCEACFTTTSTTTTTTTDWQSPFFMMTCDGKQVRTTEHMTFSQYDSIVADVVGIYNGINSTCEATYCPQADFAGCVLRIAGHDFMDYRDEGNPDEIGGADACLDLHDPDNNGLHECIYGGGDGENGVDLADIYKDYCTTVSLADFFVIAAEAVMNISRQHVLDEDPSRSPVDFRSQFKWGRTTALNCAFAHGRLPNPENSCTAVETTFVSSMGLSWTQAAALSGVHTLGRAEISRSGYSGWWSDAKNSRKFNNDYFTSIVLKGWAPEVSVNGNPGKNQWTRVDVGYDPAANGKEMMLNTDMCLYFTMDDDGEIELDSATALENECNCTWASAIQLQDATELYNGGEFCGTTEIPGGTNFPRQRALCCGEQFNLVTDQWIDCGLPIAPQGPAAGSVKKFANNEDSWLTAFNQAWKIATTNGFDSLSKLRLD